MAPALWPWGLVLFFLDVLYDEIFFLVSSWRIVGSTVWFVVSRIELFELHSSINLIK